MALRSASSTINKQLGGENVCGGGWRSSLEPIWEIVKLVGKFHKLMAIVVMLYCIMFYIHVLLSQS